MYINYEYYRVFYYAAQCGNLTKAAALLQNSQPNLTPRDQNAGGGAWLHALFRTNPRPDPDAGGRGALPPHPRGLCRDRGRGGRCHAEPDARARERVSRRERGRAALSAAAGAAEFRARHPGVHLRISNHSTPQAVAALHETTADFAVVTTPAALSPSLTQTRVRPIQEVPVCAPEFSVLLDRTVTLADLAAHPLITLGAGTTSHDFYAAVFARRGVPFQPVIEAATADQIIPMAEAGLGVGIVPQDFIRTSDRVRTIELDEPLPPRAVCIVKRKGHPLSVAARELERMLLTAGAEQCACGEVRRADFVTQ